MKISPEVHLERARKRMARAGEKLFGRAISMHIKGKRGDFIQDALLFQGCKQKLADAAFEYGRAAESALRWENKVRKSAP